MATVYFIADTHFGDDALRRYECRPFKNVAQMDEAIAEAWNRVVSEQDTVYVLGDFGADGYEMEMLARLKGIKYLIKGNHDGKSNEEYRSFGFREVYDHPIILDGFWILSHEAVYVNTNMPYANLFGHVHNSPLIKDYSEQHYCVCVERTGYAPIAFGEIKAKIREAVERRHPGPTEHP